MNNWKLFLFIKSILYFNYINTLYNDTLNRYKNIYKYIKDYYHGHNDIWLFISGNTLPLSLNNVNNNINTVWTYDNYDNTLVYSTNDVLNVCNFSWLSANVIIDKDKEYEIDSFIEKVTIHTSDINPSFHTIFICWCIYTKNWFHTDNVKFHIFTDTGEELFLRLDDTCHYIKNKTHKKLNDNIKNIQHINL